MTAPESRDEITEWRVETEQTVDEFGADEQGAREWLTYCESRPEWLPASLMRRVVVTETFAWEVA